MSVRIIAETQRKDSAMEMMIPESIRKEILNIMNFAALLPANNIGK